MDHPSPQRATADRAQVPDNAPRFYSVADTAALLAMSPMTLYRAIAAGEFPAVRIRGRLIVPAGAIEAMAEIALKKRAVVDAADWVLVPANSAARTGGGVSPTRSAVVAEVDQTNGAQHSKSAGVAAR